MKPARKWCGKSAQMVSMPPHNFFSRLLLFSCVAIAPVSNFPQPAVSNPEEREIVRNGDVSAGTDSTSGADHTRRRSTLPASERSLPLTFVP